MVPYTLIYSIDREKEYAYTLKSTRRLRIGLTDRGLEEVILIVSFHDFRAIMSLLILILGSLNALLLLSKFLVMISI